MWAEGDTSDVEVQHAKKYPLPKTLPLVPLLLGALLVTAAVSRDAQGRTITVPAGTRLLVRMIGSVNPTRDHVGKRFRASLESNLVVNGTVVARRGSNVYGRLAQAKSAGRIKGPGKLTLELNAIMIHGTAYPILTDSVHFERNGSGASMAKKTGGALGAGAAAGGVASVLTGGKQVNVPMSRCSSFGFTSRRGSPFRGEAACGWLCLLRLSSFVRTAYARATLP